MSLTFDQLSEYAVTQGASDIHISTNLPPMVRIDGDMKAMKSAPMTLEDINNVLDHIMDPVHKEAFKNDLEADFSVSAANGVRFRVNAFNTLNGPASTMRMIPARVKTLEELKVPEILFNLSSLPKGLVLVTGPTGSGKSTTLAAMIDYINHNYHKHIITIEDPIEFVHHSDKCLINQREVGTNTKTFAKALRSALREDPDIILLGELRDLESISLALTAAETGHLVFGTLHTSSAAQTINRIIDVFPGEDKDMIRTMLSTSLEGVIAQRLLPKADSHGRVAAFEVMIANSAVKNLIRENKIPQIQSLIQVGSKDGMILMSDYVNNLVLRGLVREDQAESLIRTAKSSANSMQREERFIESVVQQAHDTEF